MKRLLTLWAILSAMTVFSACNINTPAPTPTAQQLPSETNTVEPSTTPSLTPSATLPASDTPVVLSSPVQATPPPQQPTLPPAPVATEGPYVYVIQLDDTLGYILQLQPWGYPPFDQGVIRAVVQLNNLANENVLPPPGSELLIPRRTATPIPEGIEATQTQDTALGVGTRIGNVTLPRGAVAGCHFVVEGDSIISIAERYNTTLEILSQLNQNLNWFGCQFDTYSGGPNCNPFITVNLCVNVPLPTPTPIPSPTPSGSETATPTPTFAPARGIFPPNGAIAPATGLTLQWVSVGELRENDVYLIEVQDLTNSSQWLQVTRQNSVVLPDTLIPTDGQAHQLQWRVSVAQQVNGIYNYVGGVGAWRSFQWQSR
jgi:hypothetical protein